MLLKLFHVPRRKYQRVRVLDADILRTVTVTVTVRQSSLHSIRC